MGEMILPRDAMAHAIDCAERGDVELGKLWLDIARELREGSQGRPQMPGKVQQVAVPTPRPFESRAEPSPLDGAAVQLLDFGQRYEDDPSIVRAEHVMQSELDHETKLMTRPHDDPSAAVVGDPDSDADTFYGYTRGQARPPSRTAYAAAVKTRKSLDDGGPLPYGFDDGLRAAASSLVDEILSREPKAELDETLVARDAFGPDGLQQVAETLRSMDDHPQRWVTGVVETDEQRDDRFATAPPVRPYVDASQWDRARPERFDAFERGRASVDRAQRRLEETGILSAGDPSRCRHCDAEIYEADPSGVGTSHRYRHKLSGQAICTTPPRGTSEQGDESYVTGSHTMAEPGGVPYRGW